MPYGRQRANFLVEHYWDRCPWKSAFSSPGRMELSLREFASFLPHASADTVMASINRLIGNVRKKPEYFNRLLQMAEATFHCDTAILYSDQVFIPFAREAASNKKLPAETRQHYAAVLQVLENSSEGAKLPAIPAIDVAGTPVMLNDTTPGVQTYVYFFERPDDSIGRLDRVMFANNVAVSKLVEAGFVKPIVVYTSTANQSWQKRDMPQGWSAIAIDNADQWFDLSASPAIYLTDSTQTITAKLLPVGSLTANCQQLVSRLGL